MVSMSGHTPGPWVAQGHIVRAVVDGREVPVSQGFTLEDARLIAAAPDLLACLAACVAAMDEVDRDMPVGIAARAAIAKAAGKEG